MRDFSGDERRSVLPESHSAKPTVVFSREDLPRDLRTTSSREFVEHPLEYAGPMENAFVANNRRLDDAYLTRDIPPCEKMSSSFRASREGIMRRSKSAPTMMHKRVAVPATRERWERGFHRRRPADAV